jgi:hypothetical protein
VDVGTLIAYKHSDRPWGQSEKRRKHMATKKSSKKLKAGKKITAKKNLEWIKAAVR